LKIQAGKEKVSKFMIDYLKFTIIEFFIVDLFCHLY